MSFFLHEPTDTVIITTIILISSLLGFWQEKGAADAFEKLLATVQIRATVLREGIETEVPLEKVVPGDIIILNAGDIIPADCLILDSKDLFVSEATLTGETYPVEKAAGILKAATLLVGSLTLCFPYTPLAVPFGFKPLPISIILILGAIIGLYILTAETIKKVFYRKVKF